MTSTPVTPTDVELAKIVNDDPYLLISLRELFNQAGTLTPEDVEALQLAIGSAANQATQANDTLNRIANALEMAALRPQREDIKQDDLTPVFQQHHQDTLADLAPV